MEREVFPSHGENIRDGSVNVETEFSNSRSEDEVSESEFAVDSSDDAEALADKVAQQSRKRKYDGSHEARVSKKHTRMRQFAYIQLLNSEIENASVAENSGDARWNEDSIHGALVWTAEEKRTFFHKIARTRRHGLHESNDGLPSKSDIEILGYQRLLNRSSQELYLNGSLEDIISQTDHLAAFELSQACCEALEQAADTVASLQWKYERGLEEKRFADHALLTQDISKELENLVGITKHSKIASPVQSEAIDHKIDEKLQKATRILRLGNWLELSERVFMNLPLPDDRDVVEPIATGVDRPALRPGLLATAFNDLYDLCVSVTRRLVSAALFQAMSRLRATDIADGNRRKLFVKRRDVITALNIQGMDHDSRQFWRGAARRLGLGVYLGKRNKSGRYSRYGEQLSYDEVEQRLDQNFEETADEPLQQNLEIQSDLITSDADPLPSPDDPDAESDSEQHEESDEGISQLADESEEYLEAFDCVNSSKEEHRMWQILKIKPASAGAPGDVQIVGEPEPNRKAPDELKSWRDQVNFRSCWERYGECLPQESFQSMHGGRSLGAKTGTIGSAGSIRANRATSSSRARAVDRQENLTMMVSPENSNNEHRIPNKERNLGGSFGGDGPEGAARRQARPTSRSRSRQSSRRGRSLQRNNSSESDDSTGSQGAQVANRSVRRSLPRRGTSTPMYALQPQDGEPMVQVMDSESEDEYEP